MNDRDIIAIALSSFDTSDDPVGSAENIISLTLEKASNEAEMLRRETEGETNILAGALCGRLQALNEFVDRYMDVTWRVTRQQEVANDVEVRS